MSADTTWPTPAFEQGVLARPFHLRLRALIAESGYTQAALAKEVGVSREHLSNLANGRGGMSARLALQFERVLGVPAERLWIWQGLSDLAALRHNSQHNG